MISCKSLKVIDRIRSITFFIPVFRESFCRAIFLGVTSGNTLISMRSGFKQWKLYLEVI